MSKDCCSLKREGALGQKHGALVEERGYLPTYAQLLLVCGAEGHVPYGRDGGPPHAGILVDNKALQTGETASLAEVVLETKEKKWNKSMCMHLHNEWNVCRCVSLEASFRGLTWLAVKAALLDTVTKALSSVSFSLVCSKATRLFASNGVRILRGKRKQREGGGDLVRCAIKREMEATETVSLTYFVVPSSNPWSLRLSSNSLSSKSLAPASDMASSSPLEKLPESGLRIFKDLLLLDRLLRLP